MLLEAAEVRIGWGNDDKQTVKLREAVEGQDKGSDQPDDLLLVAASC